MDFSFLQNPLSKKWVILAPRRAKRPDESRGTAPACPFCPGKISEEIVYRVPPQKADEKGEGVWKVIVLKNKFPFAPIHEVIVHSPDHHKNFDEMSLPQSALVLTTFRQRFNEHKKKGQVYIFHNHGAGGGESLPHPHTQLAVVPFSVELDTPALDPNGTIGCGPAPVFLKVDKGSLESSESSEENYQEQTVIETEHFSLLCPRTSQWPDEIWVLPKRRGQQFGDITDEEIADFAKTLFKLIRILDLRHGHEFPFNFYIYPGNDWYLRLIPRQKNLGGFELGTNIFVNTQDPVETAKFIKEHFENPDIEKIKTQQADYSKNI